VTERANQIAATVANHLNLYLDIEQCSDNRVIVATRDSGQRFTITVTEAEAVNDTEDCA
jgi:hypothetical protein